MKAPVTYLKQPECQTEWGPFKVWVRTDGRWVVVDRRKHWAELPMFIFTKAEPALRRARELWEAAGKPAWEE